ncbi:hypothetical protein ACPA9J_17240 [Pseudomonas aeruginosa]
MRPAIPIAPCARSWPRRPRQRLIAEQAPWALAKQEGQQDKVQAACGLGINPFRQLRSSPPVLLELAAAAEAFLNVPSLTCLDYQTPVG